MSKFKIVQKFISTALLPVLIVLLACNISFSQSFDYDKLNKITDKYMAVVDMNVTLSFGVHSTDHDAHLMGTIVSEDGLVLFDASIITGNYISSSLSNINVKAEPNNITVTTSDGTEYPAEYIGADKYTGIGFVRIGGDENKKFDFVKLQNSNNLKVGDWLTLYMLLPEYVSPATSVDVGMVSAILDSPEQFYLTVGFSPIQTTSVLYDEQLNPVGILGLLNTSSMSNFDSDGMNDNGTSFDMPLLGVVPSEKINKLIASPPKKNQTDRGWLGITLQALTKEMADIWSLDLKGGIIINEVVNNSPAQIAGLLVGDIIYEVNGQQVEVDREEKVAVFQRDISEKGPGAAVELSVKRPAGDSFEDLKLLTNLEKAPIAPVDAPDYENEILEFKVREMVFADYLYHDLDQETFKGVVVSEIKQGGLADLEGLMIGDIVKMVDNRPIASIDEFSKILEDSQNNQNSEIIFFILRHQKTMFVNVKPEWPAQ